MIQSIYTQVSNADIVSCGKKGETIKSDPIPLLKDKYLGEYRTALEKAKVRKNLGIADSVVQKWGNITGFIEEQTDLIDYINFQQEYKTELSEEVTNVKQALDYALEFVTNFKSDSESLDQIQQSISSINESIKKLDTLTNDHTTSISELETSIVTINKELSNLNLNLENIDVDKNISDWINNKLQNSKTINLIDNSLEVIISDKENNAIKNESGLYVQDLSEDVTKATENISSLQDNVSNILDTYVTKEELGGDNFNFAHKDTFDQFVSSTTSELSNIKKDLSNTVKTGEDGHVDTLYVNTISKNNDSSNIKITDSFEVESGIPLDVRFVVDNLDELLALPVKVCYSGMGVVVNSLSSLYILREPTEGTSFNQEYISNVYNWKCPEDLVTVALTREDYDNLEEINPNVFYYIYEDEITRTKEPKRKDYSTEEEFQIEWQKWVESLKTLSQEYMSASWGIEIEEKLSSKASNTLVSNLNTEIEKLNQTIQDISGGEGSDSLSSLSTRLTSAEEDLKYLLGTEESAEEPTVKGKISEIEESIDDLDNKIVSEFVTIESITNESPDVDYIFVKKSDYETDKQSHETAISNEVKTKQVVTNGLNLSELPVTSNGTDLLINNKEVALLDEVPKIEYLLQSEYDKKLAEGTIDPEVYYYTTDDISYVTNKGLEDVLEKLNVLLQTLATDIQTLKEDISDIKTRLSALESNS